jgi:hypothetical protein
MKVQPAHKRAGEELDAEDRALVVAGLVRALAERGTPAESVVLAPGPHLRPGSFPNETAVCRLSGGEVLRVFCKCSKRVAAPAHRHRFGVAYEAEVYRRFLRPLPESSAELIGSFESDAGAITVLYLEEVQDVLRVSSTPRANMARASAWIGRFHADSRGALTDGRADILTRYDSLYYRQWPRRALALNGPLRHESPWLPELCRVFSEELVPVLTGAEQTVIHGELYPINVLARGETIFPVDWESAAVGPGEIDLASLVEGWSEADRIRCLAAYERARWPDGALSGHLQALDAAAVYWHLRWLGNGRYFATGKLGHRRLVELGALARRLDLIPRRSIVG